MWLIPWHVYAWIFIHQPFCGKSVAELYRDQDNRYDTQIYKFEACIYISKCFVRVETELGWAGFFSCEGIGEVQVNMVRKFKY